MMVQVKLAYSASAKATYYEEANSLVSWIWLWQMLLERAGSNQWRMLLLRLREEEQSGYDKKPEVKRQVSRLWHRQKVL